MNELIKIYFRRGNKNKRKQNFKLVLHKSRIICREKMLQKNQKQALIYLVIHIRKKLPLMFVLLRMTKHIVWGYNEWCYLNLALVIHDITFLPSFYPSRQQKTGHVRAAATELRSQRTTWTYRVTRGIRRKRIVQLNATAILKS